MLSRFQHGRIHKDTWKSFPYDDFEEGPMNSINFLLQTSKYREFMMKTIQNPIVDVIEVPGIGKISAKILRNQGYVGAHQLYGALLMFNMNQINFVNWMTKIGILHGYAFRAYCALMFWYEANILNNVKTEPCLMWSQGPPIGPKVPFGCLLDHNGYFIKTEA